LTEVVDLGVANFLEFGLARELLSQLPSGEPQ
jgi:hypothetical protein